MSDPLKVAFLSHAASPQAPTGAERSLALLAEGMSARGHHVSLVAPGAFALRGGLEAAGVRVRTVACRACWLTYYHPRSVPETALRWVRYALPDPGRLRLTALLRHLGPDVVHVNCLPHLRGGLAGRRAGIPVVWHIREILPPGERRRWFARRLARDATAVVAVSEAVAGWLAQEGLDDLMTVVPNGVSLPESLPERALARRELGLPEDGVLVGLFGQVLPHKGVVEFCRAAASASREEPVLRFVVAGAGSGEFIGRVRSEAAGLIASGRLCLLGPQPSGTRLVAAADVVCLTTTTPDPFPRAVLEAMAAGRPVVAFQSGGVAEMVADGRTGILVTTGDILGFAAGLIRLARDPAARMAMGNAGAVRAREEFGLDLHLDRMEAVLRRAAGR